MVSYTAVVVYVLAKPKSKSSPGRGNTLLFRYIDCRGGSGCSNKQD